MTAQVFDEAGGGVGEFDFTVADGGEKGRGAFCIREDATAEFIAGRLLERGESSDEEIEIRDGDDERCREGGIGIPL